MVEHDSILVMCGLEDGMEGPRSLIWQQAPPALANLAFPAAPAAAVTDAFKLMFLLLLLPLLMLALLLLLLLPWCAENGG